MRSTCFSNPFLLFFLLLYINLSPSAQARVQGPTMSSRYQAAVSSTQRPIHHRLKSQKRSVLYGELGDCARTSEFRRIDGFGHGAPFTMGIGFAGIVHWEDGRTTSFRELGGHPGCLCRSVIYPMASLSFFSFCLSLSPPPFPPSGSCAVRTQSLPSSP